MWARPRSASSSSVRLPMPASATARLAETLVLPTPPLPPVTAMVRTGPSGSLRVADSGKVLVSLAYSRDGMVQLRVAGHIGRSAQIFKAKYKIGCAGPVQVLRNILAIGHPGDRQGVVDGHRQGVAEAAGLVQLAQYQPLQVGGAEAADHLVHVTEAGVGRQHQQGADLAGGAQPLQLGGQRSSSWSRSVPLLASCTAMPSWRP
ncbi:hypothetical protein G6F54_013480 [Rhizopus delemar]|nr:hypothetical protein G6F54_013480 [Rhizopus delemar]